MPAVAVKEAPESVTLPTSDVRIRRFELADLTSEGPWLLPRLLKAYPDLTQHSAAGWLKGVMYSPEFMFVHLPNAVGLAQLWRGDSLEPYPMVRERFVFVKNPESQEQQAHAAEFYTHWHTWALRTSASVMLVEEMSDVPHEMIRITLGRLLERSQWFVKVS